MPLYIGSKRVKDLYIGSTKIKELYCGPTKVYSASAPGPVPGTVIFESSTPGTYTVTIPATGNYEIWMVGGGHGGKYLAPLPKPYIAGASGGYIHGTTQLSAGTYEAVVSPETTATQVSALGYYNTTFADQVAAGGSTECTVTLPGLTATKGNAGTSGTGNTQTGGASVYGGYGKGGDVTSGSLGAGTPGYIKIVAA